MVKKDLNTDLVNLQDENDELRFELGEERKRNLENYKKLIDETERQKEMAEEKVRIAQEHEKAMMDTLASFLKDREEVGKLLEELTHRVEKLEEK
ncbi:MAG: hypothetical protein HUJ56_00270 [Erysipelotrichaceae bacterium]|nr:hypothetical protein [Erysipelotrichaceae bacterium]